MMLGRIRIRAARLGLVLLTIMFTTSCGGVNADQAPADATPEDFCLTMAKLTSDLKDGFRESIASAEASLPTGEELADIMRKWSADMVAVGTPEGIPEEARSGFERWVEEAANTEADDVDPANLEETGPSQEWEDMSGEDFTSSRAFNTYIADTCSDLYRERGLL